MEEEEKEIRRNGGEVGKGKICKHQEDNLQLSFPYYVAILCNIWYVLVVFSKFGCIQECCGCFECVLGVFWVYIRCYQCVLGDFRIFKCSQVSFRCILRVLSVVECFECIVECFGVFGGILRCCECVFSLYWMF